MKRKARKRRCQCHKPRHKRKASKALLMCDVILGLMSAVFIFFLLYLVVFPAVGVEVELSFVVNVLYSGIWFVVLLIIVNIGWAIYYGCHKSKGGVLLSMMTAGMMLYTYLFH